MEAPQQTLPRMEPGHVSDQKLPRVEGEGIHDDVAPSEYPKYIEHPVRGLTKAQDADHEAMLQAEIAALPPVPPPTQQELAKAELEKTLGRPLTDLECMVGAAQLLDFVTEKRMLVAVHPELDGTLHAPESLDFPFANPSVAPEGEPEAETLARSNESITPLPDVSPEAAAVVEVAVEPPAAE